MHCQNTRFKQAQPHARQARCRFDQERATARSKQKPQEGQIRGIRNMVEHDAYCPDILIQCAAVNAALNAFNRDLVAQHIRNCVTRDIKNGDDQVVDELVKTLQKLMK